MTIRTLLLCALFVTANVSSASAEIISGSITDSLASLNGGGVGQNPVSDYLGIVTAAAPLEINGTNNVDSGFTPAVGDVIGRDLVSTGFSFTGDSVEWSVIVPAVEDPAYIDDSFNLDATFNASTAFLGNAFSATQPNALEFELFFDGVSQATFEAQSGVHSAAALSGMFNAGAPASEVRVVMTFPDGNSFNAASEEFHVFADSLVVNYSYSVVPEPTSLTLVALLGLAGFVRRRK